MLFAAGPRLDGILFPTTCTASTESAFKAILTGLLATACKNCCGLGK